MWQVTVCLSMIYMSVTATGQDCNLPILSKFENPTTVGFSMSWLDFNDEVAYYEIELGTKGFSRTLTPTISQITEKTINLDQLNSGVTYEIYIRSICTTPDTSLWNGPYFYNTVIDNNTTCDLSLAISDNNCPNRQEFLINVDTQNSGTIGQDIDITSVELLIDHTWPPDLQLRLTAPTGESALLSRHNGNGQDNYGDISILDCSSPAIFSDYACEGITEYVPPFVGQFRPEDQLRDIFDGVNASGNWILEICDRAAGDVGILKAIKINFTDFLCAIPQDFIVENIEADNVLLSWTEVDICQNYKLSYRQIDAPLAETSVDFVECDKNTFTISGLESNTTYIVTINTVCSDNNESNTSCVLDFTTACGNSQFTESFDALPICNISCDSICVISPLWHNVEGSTQWLVNDGPTLSQRTGPSSDITSKGNYIYIENNPTECASEDVILESNCISVTDFGECNLSFYYHMYGTQVQSLSVEAQYGDGIWQSLWSLSGNQGDAWNYQSISIPQAITVGAIRIIATKSDNAIRNDIAIDQIKLIGVDTVSPMEYYIDQDQDGFGIPEVTFFSCETSPPVGYADNSDDCDDNNPLINPAATEINCNLIDENCNGNGDDVSTTDLQYTVTNIQQESCLGLADGTIEITVSNGQPPYNYSWSNGAETPTLSNIETGIYYVTLSDVGDCMLESEPIFVGFDNVINYSIANITSPSCSGQADGSIGILVSGGLPPYDISWASGIEGLTATGLSDGFYAAAITDTNGCMAITDSIQLTSPQVITAGIAIQRDVDCPGGNDGFLQLGITGGIPPYDILWSNNVMSIINSQLEEGTYTVTITDSQGCENVIDNIIVNDPQTLSISIDNQEDVSCSDGSDGMLDISVDGGIPPYSYFWSDGTRTEDLLEVVAGRYSLTVTDFNACSAIVSDLSITEPSSIDIEIENLLAVDCPGSNDGLIDVMVTGGVSDYSYNWSTTDGIDSQSDALINLSSGLYSLTVVDALGCKSVPLFFEILNRNNAIDVRTAFVDDIQCFGDSTASIMAEIGNGQSPYDYNWSSGKKTIKNSIRDTLYDLIAGSYNLTVTDGEGCTGVSDIISIDEPEEIKIDSFAIEENLCWYDTEGTIELTASGGSGSLQYHWSNDDNMASIRDLVNGNYSVTISDDLGCELVVDDILLSSHEAITFSSIIQNTNTENGAINIQLQSGLQPVIYNWYDPVIIENSSTISGLSPGTYNVMIEDAAGCIMDTSFVIDMLSRVSDTEALSIDIYPNPGLGEINILMDNSSDVEVSVYNINGGKVHRELVVTNKENRLDLQHLMDGLYMIMISQNGKSKSFKYMKL